MQTKAQKEAARQFQQDLKDHTDCLVECYHVYGNKKLEYAVRWANDCYNEVLYLVRQDYFARAKKFKKQMRDYKHGRTKTIPKWDKRITKQQLIDKIKQQSKAKQNTLADDALLIKSISNVVDNVLNAWSSYLAGIADYKKHPYKYLGKPKLPKYLRKHKRHALETDNQVCKALTDRIHSHAFDLNIKMSDNLKYWLDNPMNDKLIAKLPRESRIRTIWFKPIYNGIKVCVSYIVPKTTRKTYKNKPVKLNDNIYVGADPGINNLFALATNNVDHHPLIINGRGIKSVNQFYNMKMKQLQTKATQYKQKGVLIEKKDGTSEWIYHTGKLYSKLVQWRDNKITTAIHKATDRIIDYAISCGASQIIVGCNKYWKQKTKMSHVTNQHFCSIPHWKVIKMLKYKAKLYGIKVIAQPESYTSQTSFLDNEFPVWANGDESRKRRGIKPAKRRKKRGYFVTNQGYIMNADVNGALQIARKYNNNYNLSVFCNSSGQKATRKQIVGAVSHPVKWTPYF